MKRWLREKINIINTKYYKTRRARKNIDGLNITDNEKMNWPKRSGKDFKDYNNTVECGKTRREQLEVEKKEIGKIN